MPGLRGRPLDIRGGGTRKNFEIKKFFLKSGEKNICTQASCIYSITENVNKYFRVGLGFNSPSDYKVGHPGHSK